MNLIDLSMLELRDAIASGQVSAEAATAACLSQAHALNPSINALIDIFDQHAINQARAIDRQRASGKSSLGPLAGVPVVVKDNICLSWGRTTCASRFLENYQSPYTASAAQRLIDAGAVIIAKANLDEFAMGSSGEHSAFGATRNPWDHARVPGGSSSGSCAAVAAGIVAGALGSDTGGSIRMPAGMCNLVGFKPSYGRVSRYGLVAYASSLDQISPCARTVTDVAAMASIISGVDPRDATSLDQPPADLLTDLNQPVTNLVIGVPKIAHSAANHPAVQAALANAVVKLRELGARVIEVELPSADYGIAAYYIIAAAEASSNLARFDGIRYGRRCTLAPAEGLAELYGRSRAEGFGPEVRKRIMLGTYVLSSGYYEAYYATAQKARTLISADYARAFSNASASGAPACHALLLPSAPGPAWVIGEKANDPLAMYLEDVYTVGVNLAGLPAVSVPAGFAVVNGKRLPVGLQFIGPALADALLLRVARMFEIATGFGKLSPPK